MTNLLLRLFVKDYRNTNDAKVRQRYGMLSSVVSIVLNILLAVSKIVLGAVSGLISIMADGLNNLTDCGSNVVSMVSFQLSNKPADKEHPYGHQRIEYVSSMIVAFIILYIGVQLAIESFGSIVSPTLAKFNYATIAVLVLSVIVKLYMCLFNQKLGKAIDSTLLKSTAQDSLNDVFSTVAVIVAYVVSALTNFSIDGYVGMIVSVIIVWSGIGILRETASYLVGVAPSQELVDSIIDKIMKHDTIYNLHDIVVHSYGANNNYASVHLEVDSNMTLQEGHDIADHIEKDFAEMGINIVVHIDPVSRDDAKYNEYYGVVNSAIKSLNNSYHVQDFRMVSSCTTYNLVFEVAVPIDYNLTDEEIKNYITDKVHLHDSQATLVISIVTRMQ